MTKVIGLLWFAMLLEAILVIFRRLLRREKMKKFTQMAYESSEEMVFGKAKFPVECGLGLKIGDGYVTPELKYAPRPGKEESLETLLEEYRRITEDALERAVQLGLPSLVLELEHVFQLTANPEWGGKIARMTRDMMEEYHQKYGLKTALKSTIADIRKPENDLRNSKEYKTIIEAFHQAGSNGADILCIESIGGKEVFNHCVTRQDMEGMIFSVGILGSRDMKYIWTDIVDIASQYGIIPGGDPDCAHSNTTMFLAGGLLSTEMSHTFAALVRVLGAVRSLVAFECGAKGPDKDCGYEGVILKAITGCPISMEGKTSACAHSDLMGNLAAATCDLWSNEAVQYGDMFGGTTAEVFTEILGYDVSLMNTALKMGSEKVLRDMMILSDKYRDPQALILAPDSAYAIGEAIISESSYYKRSIKALKKALQIINEADQSGKLILTKFEKKAADQAQDIINNLPESEEEFIANSLEKYSAVEDFYPAYYELGGE